MIIGDTGSGKSTQVAKYLINFNTSNKIGCTQPRRIAAMTISKRVATELNSNIGDKVGYCVRFEKVLNKKVRIKYLTEGILVREIVSDTMLSKYGIIVVDEAHERTLCTDLIIGTMKEIIKNNLKIKLIIMSATLEVQKFYNYFWNSSTLLIPGRLYKVNIFYTKAPEKNYKKVCLSLIMGIARSKKKGTMLIFLAGEEEIEDFNFTLSANSIGIKNFPEIVPLYSNLNIKFQDRIFQDIDKKSSCLASIDRIILSTNIAETSITISNVRYVIDSGFSKKNIYHPRLKIDSLIISSISKASAHQRAGRAGRTSSGKCFRIYTEHSFNVELSPQNLPEILRSNLNSLILILKKMGIRNIIDFDFLDPPSPEIIMRSLEVLIWLAAINRKGKITENGIIISEFPLEPEYSTCIVNSIHLKTVIESVTIVSMIISNMAIPFEKTNNDNSALNEEIRCCLHPYGDHLTMLSLYNTWRLKNKDTSWCLINNLNPRLLEFSDLVRTQLFKYIGLMKNHICYSYKSIRKYYNDILKSFFLGFGLNVAYSKDMDQYYTLFNKYFIEISPESFFNFNYHYIIFDTIVLTSKLFVKKVSRIKFKWLANMM
mmetsp:Transcript_6965/g.10791  ORF Transcript_6965/g.10791 Transcript_6965/m.10791 type:complete len:600 (-) Transcript_6965:43-1842(-)